MKQELGWGNARHLPIASRTVRFPSGDIRVTHGTFRYPSDCFPLASDFLPAAPDSLPTAPDCHTAAVGCFMAAPDCFTAPSFRPFSEWSATISRGWAASSTFHNGRSPELVGVCHVRSHLTWHRIARGSDQVDGAVRIDVFHQSVVTELVLRLVE